MEDNLYQGQRIRLEALALACAHKSTASDDTLLKTAALYEKYIDLGIESVKGYKVTNDDNLEEMDRCARAYGWEVGNGHPLAVIIEDISEDNPFIHENWRDDVLPREID